MTHVLYFSYGSNMSTRRLTHRTPSARIHSVARLEGHKLAFHKHGKDGSGKCDIVHTQDPLDIVMGVIYSMTHSDKLELDKHEGLGLGYEEKPVTLIAEDGRAIEAFTYYAININPTLQPFHWYKKHVLAGARENRLPHDYIHSIESINSIEDPDARRHAIELEIYRK